MQIAKTLSAMILVSFATIAIAARNVPTFAHQRTTGAQSTATETTVVSVHSSMPNDQCTTFKQALGDGAVNQRKDVCGITSTTTKTVRHGSCATSSYSIHQQPRSDVYAWSASQDEVFFFSGVSSLCKNRSVVANTARSKDAHHCRADYGIGFKVKITACETSGNGSLTAHATFRFSVSAIAGVPIFVGHGGDIIATIAKFTDSYYTTGF